MFNHIKHINSEIRLEHAHFVKMYCTAWSNGISLILAISEWKLAPTCLLVTSLYVNILSVTY